MLLASHSWKSGMLLTILKSTGHTIKNALNQNVGSAMTVDPGADGEEKRTKDSVLEHVNIKSAGRKGGANKVAADVKTRELGLGTCRAR